LCLLGVFVGWSAANTCTAATLVSTLPFVSQGDTSTQDFSSYECSLYTNPGSGQGFWYRINVARAQQITASLCSSVTNFDSYMTVFRECSSSTGRNCMEYNDDSCAGKSRLSFHASAATNYWLFVSGWGSATGHFELEIYESTTATNWNCSTAMAISALPFVAEQSTVEAPSSYSFCSFTITSGLWFKVTGTGGVLEANTCNDAVDYDTVIEIYGACDADGATQCLAQNDDSCGTASKITWPTTIGHEYWIFVTGYSSNRGSFVLTVQHGDSKLHDDCSSAIEVIGIPFIHFDSTANISASFSSCFHLNKKSLWFVLTGTGEKITATTCYENNQGHDTMIEVYDNCVLSNETGCLAYNDDFCGLYSAVSWTSIVNQQYWIAVSGYHSDSNGVDFTLTIVSDATSSNDQCWYADTVAIPSVFSQSTVGCTHSQGGCNGASYSRQGRWYVLSPQENMQVVASTCNNATVASVTIEVYTSCTILQCLAESHTVCTDKSEVKWSAQRGHYYYIFVSTPQGGDPGFFHVQFYESNPANHSTCEGALDIPYLPYQLTADTFSSVHIADGCLGQTKQGTWFKLTGTGNKIRADTCGYDTEFDTIIEAYASCRTTSCLSYNDDMTDCGRSSMVSFSTDLGAQYYIFVTGFGSETGIFTLNIMEEIAPSNSKCSGALEVTSESWSSWDYTFYSAPSAGDCADSTGQYKGLWYRVGGKNQQLDISTCNTPSHLTTVIQVFSSCVSDVGIGCNSSFHNDGTCPPQSHVSIPTYATKDGQPTYWFVFVRGFNGEQGYIGTSFSKIPLAISSEVDGGGLSGGAIAGVIFGVMFGIAGLGAAGAVGFMYWHKRQGYKPLGGSS